MVNRALRAPDRDDGVVATYFIVVLTAFMFAAAAIAVDLSDFFEDARVQQNAADMACLAGIRHLPEDEAAARDEAARNLVSNLGAIYTPANLTDPAVQSGGSWLSDDGRWEVVTTTPLNGNPNRLQVTVRQASATTFALWMGIGDALVARTATCSALSPGGGDLPLGVLPGEFSGVLKDGGECGSNTGNCQVLRIPRNDVAGAANQIRYNIALGVQRELQVWAGSDAHCNTVSPCNIIATEPGNNVGPVSDGLVDEFSGIQGRLRSPLGTRVTDPPGGNNDPVNGEHWDYLVAEGRIVVDGTTTIDWGDEYPGQDAVILPKVTQLPSCDHPRLARVPIVIHHTNEEVEWPPGSSQPMRVVGFYHVWIDEPFSPFYAAASGPPASGPSHFQGNSGQANHISGVAFDATDATCVDSGGAVTEYDPDGPKLWRLVSND